MANKNLSTYDPQKSVLVIRGKNNIPHVVGGYQEGSQISMMRKVDTFTDYTGLDDTPSRVRNNSTTMDFTVHLAQTSSTNDILQALYNADVAEGGSAGVFQLDFYDNEGRTSVNARQAYIRKIPDASRTNTISPQDWIICAVNTDYQLGGNSVLTPDEVSFLESLGVTVNDKWKP